MHIFIKTILLIVVSTISLQCSSQKKLAFKEKIVYSSSQLVITQVSENAFVHTSYKQTNDFGYVPCNGLVVSNKHESIIFDTPTNDTSAAALIQWVRDSLHCTINAIIPTHFHDDCLGGLKAFHENKIPSYAYFKTIELAKENKMQVPQNSFKDSLILKVGSEKVTVRFLGEGHTKDNVVGYFSSEYILFGGCLLKENGASKGYLGDANTKEWSFTVAKIKQEYPNIKIVVPGHGKHGNKDLLNYTIQLFQQK